MRERNALCALLLSCALAGAEDSPPPANQGRPVVAVLYLEDRTGDPVHASWRAIGNAIVSQKLQSVKAIRLVGRQPVRRAFRKAGLPLGAAVESERAREMGQFLEAQRIVFGSYMREEPRWKVSVRLLRTASGTTSSEIIASGEDWFDVSEALSLEILRELQLEPSMDERETMKKRWTSSPAALRSLADAVLANELDEPFSVRESHVKRALEADPTCARAHMLAAALAGSQGRMLEAEASARSALRLDPSHASAHSVLGQTLLEMRRRPEALVELREARRLDPDDPLPLLTLQVVAPQDDALEILQTALALDGTDSKVHASLAQIYFGLADRTKANQAMLDAERYYLGIGDESGLFFLAYLRLGDAPRALKHFEHLQAWASRTGANPEKLRQVESMAERLRATLTPVAIDAELPRELRPGELESAWRERVESAELPLFVDPLRGGALMKERATRIVEGKQGDLEKALALLDALATRSGGKNLRRRTALEALTALDSPEERFVCDDHAKLYTSLAREAGLRAFYTVVEKDPFGEPILHACSAVVVDGKVYLVDPIYRWFGAPHHSYRVLDDIQALAAHLMQDPDVTARAKVATRLWPESHLPWFLLSFACMANQEWARAREAAARAIELSPEHCLAYLARGKLAAHEGDLEKAEALLRVATAASSSLADPHYELALVLIYREKLELALAELRAGLSADPSGQRAGWAAAAIARVQEHLTGGEHLGEEIDTFRRRLLDLEKLPVR